MKSLIELEAEFIIYTGEQKMRRVDTLEAAQGLLFLCPLCYTNNNGPVRTHSVIISFAGRGVPDDQGSRNSEGKPSRWNVIGGTGINDLQLSPSIHLKGEGCGWHGHIGHSGVPAGHAQ